MDLNNMLNQYLGKNVRMSSTDNVTEPTKFVTWTLAIVISLEKEMALLKEQDTMSLLTEELE